MSRNYDNWERLVAAVVKREQIWQLCHQDSISTIASSSYLDFSSSRSFGSSASALTITDDFSSSLSFGTSASAFDFDQRLGNGDFVVHEYYSEGSVFDIFMNVKKGRPSWKSRVKIAVGAARGLAHIHAQFGGKMVHGNINSSNIFVNRQGYGCVSDFGRAGIDGWLSQEGDVYNFGLLLLQLVTGHSQMLDWLVVRLRSFVPSERDLNCFKRNILFVDEVAMEEEHRDKFPFVDLELNVSGLQQELREMLGVAKICLALLPEYRPAMSDVVLMLDGIADLRSAQSHPHRHDKKRVWNRFLRFGG